MTLFDPEPDGGTEPAPARGAAGGARRTLIVEADGGSRGNPGIAGYGALVRDPDTGRILAEKAEYVGRVSNNVAEYSGLIAALELAHSIDPDCWILAKMDSKLVVEQMSGRWKIKHADMQKLAAKARSIVNPQRVKYQWIPRELNKDADRLSNEAMDAGTAGVPWKPRAGADIKAAAAAAVLEAASSPAPEAAPTGRLHHTEIWVNDFAAAEKSLGWLLERVGYVRKDTWSTGASWQGADGYIVLEAGPDVEPGPYSRKRPGLNHLAFRAGSEADVDLLARRASSHGWTLLFADRHPYAGGAEHYAAYLENEEGFEVELVAG
ncbi:reverse transcriptase-like protein [Arthrobacter zhaoxinii]|uniref:reverse transcriptase-like protein n=1 Tax=Arthrobacter zhaoxinii TaxID=2964616 RepID=UPI0021079219|nr:reverse transcriptase-like protein [Arthrobacter zhaoxinii]MCQ2000485.1 reverse transcriptase-like protein [Arthrobacter zhaoxinii]